MYAPLNRSLLERLVLPIVTTPDGPNLGSLTKEQAVGLAKACNGEAGEVMVVTFSILYDLSPDVKRFDKDKANINPAVYNLPVRITFSENGADYNPVDRQLRAVSNFLRRRGNSQERREGYRKGSVTVLVYRV